jgi:hypothetical protein
VVERERHRLGCSSLVTMSRVSVLAFQEEPNHLSAGIGTFGIGVRSRRAPARPSMTRSVKHPLLKHDTTTVVSVGASGVADAACRLAPAYDRAEFGLTLRLSDDLISVYRVHRFVPVAVEHDGSRRTLARAARR